MDTCNGNYSDSHRSYYNRTGGAVVAGHNLPPKLGLYTITEREEELQLDDAYQQNGKLEMSGQHPQKQPPDDSGSGVPRASSLQGSDKFSAMYSSVPDMSSSGFHKSEETDQITGQESIESDMQTKVSEPKEESRTAGDTQTETKGTEQIVYEETEKVSNKTCLETSETDKYTLQDNFVTDHSVGHGFGKEKESVVQCLEFKELADETCESSFQSMSEMQPVMTSTPKQSLDELACQDENGLKSNLHLKQPDSHSGALPVTEPSDDIIRNGGENMSIQSLEEGNQQKKKLSAVAFSETVTVGVFPEENSTKPIISQEKLQIGENEDEKNLLDNVVFVEENPEDDESLSENKKETTEQEIQSGSQEKEQTKKPFSMDDVPVELRPYMPFDIDPEFMDDPESREDVYDMARQKMKEKERETKAAKLAEDLAARTGLPKGSLCPLSVKDSFDGGLNPADVLKRKMQPKPLMSGSHKAFPSSTFTLSVSGSNVSKLTVDSTPSQPLHSHTKHVSSDDLDSDDEAFIRSLKSPLSPLVIETQSQPLPPPQADASVKKLGGGSVVGPEDFLKRKQKAKVMKSLQHLDNGKLEQTELVSKTSTVQKEFGKSESGKHFNMDDVPEELRPYIPLDFNSEFMDDTESREEVYDMARQKIKEKELEQKSAKVAKELAARTGLPKGSICPLGVKDSFDTGLAAADVLKRKKLPLQMDGSTVIPSSTFTLSTDSGVSKLTNTEKILEGRSVPDSHIPSSQRPEQILPFENKKLSSGVKSSGGLRPSDLLKRKQKTDIIQAMKKSENGGALESIADKSIQSHDSDHADSASHEMESLGQNEVTEASKVQPTSSASQEQTEPIIPENSTGEVGYGNADFTNPAELLKHLEITDGENTKLSVLKEIDRNSSSDTKLSVLNKKREKHITESGSVSKSQPDIGKVSSLDSATQTVEIEEKEFTQIRKTSPTDDEQNYTTPSKPLIKTLDRQTEEEVSKSLGYSTVSQSLQTQEAKGASLDYTTPSKLLKKTLDREVTERNIKSPGYGEIEYTTPSQLIQRQESGNESLFHTTSSNLDTSFHRDVTENVSKLSEYGVTDYTTPSQLPQNTPEESSSLYDPTPSKLLKKSMDRDIAERSSRSPGYGGIDYTTPSQLLQEKSEDRSLDYSTPSKLLKKSMDRDVTERSSRSPGYGAIDYTTPSQLLREISKDSSLEYTTPSKLLKKSMDRDVTERSSRSPGYGAIDYTTPSQFLREKSKDRSLDYTTPSKLLKKSMDWDVTERSSRSPGYGAIDYTTPSQLLQEKDKDRSLDYTTPSKLLKKSMDRDITERSSRLPGYGEIDYTTPSQLLQEKSKDRSLEYTTPSKLLKKSMDRDVTERSSRSPGYGAIDYTTPSQLLQEKSKDRSLDYTTPSKLLKKSMDRDVTERSSRSPGYGEIDYTTPSQLLQEKSKDRSLEYTTPSKLLKKSMVRDITEMSSRSPGYCEIDYTTPSQLLQEKSKDRSLEYTTPSKLLKKSMDRNVTERSSRSPGYGEIDYKSPSQLLQEKSKDRSLDYTTPSKLLKKSMDRDVTERSSRSPGYGEIGYTTPSQLLQEKSEDRSLDYTTPSKLLKKSMDRDITERSSRSPGYGEIGYTTPSQLLQRQNVSEKSLGEYESSRSIKEFSVVTREDLLLAPDDIGYDTMEMAESSDSRSRTHHQSLDSLSNQSRTTESDLTVKDELDKQTQRILDSETYSDITTYYRRMSDLLMKIAREMRVKSEPHFIGMNSQIALDSVDSDGDSPGEKGHHPTPTGSDESGCWTESTWSRTYQGQSESKQPTTSEEIPGLTHDLNDTKICCDSEHTKTHETKPEEEKHDLEYQGSNYMFTPVVLATDSEDSHTKENKLKTRSSAMSSGYPLSVHSSYQERLLSSMDDSSISLTRNPSYLFRSSSTEDTSLEESLLEKEVSKMDREGISRHQQPHNIQKRHSRDHHKLHQLPERLPDDFQSLNELFWFLCMNHPDVCRSFHDSLDHLPLSCTTPEPCTPPVTQPSVHCTKLPDCTCMSCTRMPNGTHFHQGEKKSATGRSHVASRQSSRLPRPQKKLSQDLASGQKKKTLPGVRSTTPEARGYIMEKEMMESQNRKLQMEISTLQTENKLLKEKNNRAQAKIGDLEEQLTQTREELETLHSQLHQELTEVSRKSKSEAAKEIDQLQNRITSLTEENDAMRSDVAMLEKQLESAHKASDKAWQNSEKAKTLDAYKMEVITLKDEVTRVKSLLEQSERHLQEEEQRSRESNHSLLKLTEVKNLLQQQVDMGGGGATATDKQIKSLEKRLRITEERLHQERADRANNLSEVEDKLLTENARLQAIEKELSRQLQREKDKNRNLDQKVKDIREENEKLRLSLPFDESALISQKAKYDIPYGIHSTQRTETVKNPDYKHVLSQVEKEAGLKTGQEKDIICHIWSTREQIYHQLQQLEIILQDLNLRDNNITEGLKNLRDVKSQSDAKVHQLEEKLDNLKSEKAIFEATYKEQLTTLVNERHDAFARLKTAEDLMEAIRSENEILKSNVLGQSSGNLSASTNLTQTGQLESLQTERKELEGKNQQLMRSNILLEGEVSTLKVQLEARNKALEEAQNEVELAHNRLVNDEEADRKQQKIDKLTTQVSSLQSEVRLITDKFSSLLTEKNKLENDLQAAQRELNLAKVKVRDNKAGEVADSKQNQILREEIDERDRRIGQLSQECDELESQLQQVRQDLYAEQIQSQEYEAQLETYQQQVEQRGQMVDTLSRTEKEQLAQFQILKDTMDSLSQELSQKQAQNKVLQLELSKEKDKSEYMEKELKNMNKDKTEEDVEDKALPSHQLQIRELETERDQLKTELIQASTSLEQAAERDTAAQNEIKQLQQELTTEKGKVLHMSAEKGELEQNLEEIAEEHDALVQEKAQNEEDLLKLENKLEEVLQKLEMESCKHNENFTATYQNVPPEAAQMVGELESLRSLIGAKQREEDALKDRISRQQMEMDFMQRRVELLHNENECNREDVMRMTGEVVTKIKDGIATREMNQFLVKERDRLQKDNAQLEKDLEKERELRDRRKAEIADVIRKVERSEDTSKMTSRDIIQKDAIISSLESELREVKRTLQQQEVENSQLKNKSEHLSKDIHNLNSMNTSLENRLEAEKAALEEQKSQSAHRRDELMSTNHELELLKHDHSLTLNSLNAEKQTVENLKEEVSNLDDERQKLREEVRTLAMELESCKGQLNASRETIDNLKQDKGAIYHEYDSMVRKLNEKDEKIGQLQAKCDKTVEAMQKELTLQKHSLEKEKTSTERDLELAREEITSLNEEMKQKEAQLNSFGRTLQELEDTTRQKHELEIQVEKMESSSGDSSLLLESLRKETMSLQETIARQQEKLTQVQGEKTMLQDQLKIEKEKMSGQVLVLNKENAELRSQTEGEKSYLKDNLNSLQIRLSSVEANLASAIEARDKAQINSRMLERSLEETKDQLQDEVTSRKVAEQRAESLQTQLTETRKDRFLTEEKLGKAQTSLTKTEKELRTEKDRVKRLSDQTQELEATSFGHESSSKAKQDQIDLLQAEVGKLRQILESQKQQLNSKLKKTTLDMKQQVEILEEDRIKLTQQNQSLMSDLDCCREQVAVKNKENLKLQESILSLEEEMREQSSKLKQAADTIRAEEEMQAKLSSRYHAQEEELQKMKIYLSKKAEESGEADKSMWLDLNHLVQDMSRQLQEHMETQKSDVLVQKDQEGQLMKKYRKQVQDLESELSTEKALHNITKHSLQALEEDCQRLRHQLHAMRRRDNASSDKKYKNRMEAINEIIARSQAQAQAMLAASGYYDDTGVKSTLNSPRLDYHGSPDNSVASDIAYTGPMVIPPYQQTPSPPKLASSPRK